MTDKTNAMRVLDAHHVDYEVFTFSSDIHSVPDIAPVIGMPVAEIYKTLVVVRPPGKPMLVMVPGDRQLDPKRVAEAVGAKKVQMATQNEAERLTGLQVGGISALALLNKGFDIYLDRSADGLAAIVVSAGKRGVNLRLAVADLVHVTRAPFIAATTEAG
jgi:Cys-tRNA(Pro)/Cys-tRNA(Cys) deacylase